MSKKKMNKGKKKGGNRFVRGCGMCFDLYDELFSGNALITYRLRSLGKYDQRGKFLWTKKLDKKIGPILLFIFALIIIINEA